MQKNKLTLYIFIALILGVVVGYIYNANVINTYNNKVGAAETAIKIIDNKLVLLKDSTSANFKELKSQRIAQAKIRKVNDSIREDKVVYFTILSDVFLR